MKNLIKLNVIFLGFFIIFSSKSMTAEVILPLPKPTIDKETKKIIAKRKHIYPKKKRGKENEETLIQSSEKEEAFIYPQKKPIIVQKKISKIVPKSSLLSKKDFKIAISVFEAIDKKKWQTAIKLSKKARDKTLYNLVNICI